MSNRVVDATLRMVDKFTSPFNKAIGNMEKGQKQMKRAGKQIQSTGDSITKAGTKMSVGITAPVVAAGVACFNAASDMNESLNKVDVAFGKSAGGVKKWSKTTLENFGLSQGTALETASLYGDMATGMGISSKGAAGMAKNLTGLSADLSSFKNVSQDVSKDALKGIFTGEGESLKSLGVIMTDTTLQAYAVEHGMLKSTVSAEKMKEMSTKTSLAQSNLASKIKKYGENSDEAKKAQLTLNKALENQSKAAKGSYSDLSQAEKVQLRYKYVLDATKNSQGDFARTSSGAANQQRIMSERFKEISASIGQKLLPIGTKLLTHINKLMAKFSGLSDSQQKTILKVVGLVAAIGPCLIIVGKIISSVGKFAKALSGLPKALSAVGKGIGFLTSPMGLVVVGIVAVIAVGVLLYKNWDKIKAKATELWGHIKATFGGIGKWFGGLWEGVKSGFKGFINFIIGGLNKIPEGINSIKITVPKWVPKVGGKSIGFSIPSIPYLAKGTNYWQGGLAVTQDKGGEVMDLPRGTRVYPHDESVEKAYQDGSSKSKGNGITINIQKLADKLEVRSDKDINSIAERAAEKIADKFKKIRENGGEVSLA